ncbi:MAG: hypothetical protein ABJ239_05840 [Erythrobacter sp.]
MSDSNEGAAGHASRGKTPISQHPAFVIIVSVWAAALLGLPMLVMPATLAQGFAENLGLGAVAQTLIAAIAAIVGTTGGYGVARAVKSRQSQTFLSDLQDSPQIEEVLEIEPEVEAEVETEAKPEVEAKPQDGAEQESQAAHYTITMPTQFVPWPDDLPQPEVEILVAPPRKIGRKVEPKVEPEIEHAAESQPVDETPAEAPVETQFEAQADPGGELAPSQPVAEQETPSLQPHRQPQRQPIGKAVQKLRGEAVGDLNMMQLLERFAIAMADHREHAVTVQADQNHAPQKQATVASLSQALDALDDPLGDHEPGHLRTGVSVRTRAIETESALQEALIKLARLSGAA